MFTMMRIQPLLGIRLQIFAVLTCVAMISPAPMRAQTQDTLVVTGEQVGIGTDAPGADLEIVDQDYAAVRLTSIDGDETWSFASASNGQFTVNLIGSGGQEFSVNPRNDTRRLPDFPTLSVQGSVRGTQFIATSSRDLKTDFALLDGKEVLASLATTPVMSWRFKHEADSARHFGLVAEDFQEAFGLGDGKHISSSDA